MRLFFGGGEQLKQTPSPAHAHTHTHVHTHTHTYQPGCCWFAPVACFSRAAHLVHPGATVVDASTKHKTFWPPHTYLHVEA